MYPEHTALAYREAARQGADLVECDLALTRVDTIITIVIICHDHHHQCVPASPSSLS